MNLTLLGRPSSSVREIHNQDGAVLLDIQQGLCFNINPIGSKIWHMMKQQQSLDQIIDALAAEFNVPKEQVRGDVIEFATLLSQMGLLLSETSQPPRRLGWFRSLIHLCKSICVCC